MREGVWEPRFETQIEDSEYIEKILADFPVRLNANAIERDITFSFQHKKGMPGILTVIEGKGDISLLREVAETMVRHVNDLAETKKRAIEFSVDYVPKSKTVEDPALIISGLKSRSV